MITLSVLLFVQLTKTRFCIISNHSSCFACGEIDKCGRFHSWQSPHTRTHYAFPDRPSSNLLIFHRTASSIPFAPTTLSFSFYPTVSFCWLFLSLSQPSAPSPQHPHNVDSSVTSFHNSPNTHTPFASLLSSFRPLSTARLLAYAVVRDVIQRVRASFRRL